MTDLGTAMTILRMVRGWSQEDLAEAAGLRRGTISDYERGKMAPGLTTAKKLLAVQGYPWAALDMTLESIFRLRAASLEASTPVGQNGVGPSAFHREVEEVSAIAGSVLSRIIRLLLTGRPFDEERGREGEKAMASDESRPEEPSSTESSGRIGKGEEGKAA